MFERFLFGDRRRIDALEKALSACREEALENARQAKVARDDYFQEKAMLMSTETELAQLRASFASLGRDMKFLDEIKPVLF